MSHLCLDLGSQTEYFLVPNGIAGQLWLGRNGIYIME